MGAALIGMGIGMVVALLVGVLIGAALLMLACKICGVKVPSFLKALGVTLLTFVIGIVVKLVLAVVFGAIGIGPLGIQLASALILLIALALLYMPLLPTSFGKGLLVCIVEGVMAAVIALIFSLVSVGLVSFLVGMHGRPHSRLLARSARIAAGLADPLPSPRCS
jgi:hypothetical protein